MIPHFFGSESKHTIKWYEYTEEVRDHEHMICLEIEVLLDIPKSKFGSDGTRSLRESKVCNLLEGDELVLDGTDQSSGSVQAIGEKEECDKIDKGLREMPDLL